MPILLQVFICSLIGGLFSLIGGLILVTLKKRLKIAEYMTAFAAGALLATAFTDVLPEAIESSDAHSVLTWSLAGILVFFLLESCIGWFHKHGKTPPDQLPDHKHGKTPPEQHLHRQHGAAVTHRSTSHQLGEPQLSPVVPMAIIGDTIHNFIDGVAIAAAFLVSPASGIVVAFAVAAHEIPQEMGDFGLLLHNGLSRKKVILANILSSLATVLAAVTFYLIGGHIDVPITHALSLVAGFFIYIAASDIIPTIHDSKTKKIRTQKILMLLAGVIIVSLAIALVHTGVH